MKRLSKGIIRDAVAALRRYEGKISVLSTWCGSHPATLYKWRSGKATPSIESALSMERAIRILEGRPAKGREHRRSKPDERQLSF